MFKNPYIQIHLAVFLWGFTAILGKWITLEAFDLVLFRMIFAGLGFLIIPRTRNGLKNLKKGECLRLMFIGAIICLHWLCFYHAIKVINSSSLALACLGTGPLFTLWFEPFFNRLKKIKSSEIIISILAIIGIVLVAFGNKLETFSWTGNYTLALFFGILASALAAIFSLMNKYYTENIDPFTLSFVEMFSGAFFLLLFLTVLNQMPNLSLIASNEWLKLLLLSVVCTNIPFLLSIFAIKQLNPFTITLSVNLEPVYGIFFAALFFNEYNQFSINFFLGTFFLLISVFLQPILWQYEKKKS